MALTPKQEITRLLARAGGLVFILLGLWEGTQPGKSILFFGVLIGFLLVLFPGALMKH